MGSLSTTMKCFLVLIYLVSVSLEMEISGLEKVRRVRPGTRLLLNCLLEEVGEVISEDTEIIWSQRRLGETVRLLSRVRLNQSEATSQHQVDDFSFLLVTEKTGESWRYSWQLIIDDVSQEQAGVYQCKVVEGGEVLIVRNTVVEVMEEADLEHEVQYVVTKYGTEVKLDCTDFTGDSHNWSRSAARGDKSLVRVDRPDGGVYICLVGQRKERQESVDQRPVITSPGVSVFVREGGPASLHCVVSGHPPPAVTWYNNNTGHMIPATITAFTSNKLTSTLAWDNLERSDLGNYSCTAKNKIGQAEMTLELREGPEGSGSERRDQATASTVAIALFHLYTVFVIS